jgi:hypothetical protein
MSKTAFLVIFLIAAVIILLWVWVTKRNKNEAGPSLYTIRENVCNQLGININEYFHDMNNHQMVFDKSKKVMVSIAGDTSFKIHHYSDILSVKTISTVGRHKVSVKVSLKDLETPTLTMDFLKDNHSKYVDEEEYSQAIRLATRLNDLLNSAMSTVADSEK